MNCKPGDLALCVGGDDPALIGRIFRITSACPVHINHWDTDPPAYVYWCPGVAASLGDSTLRPIRDNDGEDEMLRIAGKPREVETQ